MQPEFAAEDIDENTKRSSLAESSHFPAHPINEFDALLRTAPGDSPDVTVAELQELREVIAEAIEGLSDEHRFVIDAINSERLSYSELAQRMGISKTTAHTRMQSAMAALRTPLLSHPLIRGRIRMFSTWNDAARAATHSLAPAGHMDDVTAIATIGRKMEKLRAMVNAQEVDLHSAVAAMRTIGVCAAHMLDNRGAWSVDDMVALLCRKQHDYGHGNINAFGIIGLVVRLSDKVARYVNLEGKTSAYAEPALDAIVDMVGYAVIALMLEQETFNLELDVTELVAA
jgi:predicted DNA-binding protein (UPF0251 family)